MFLSKYMGMYSTQEGDVMIMWWWQKIHIRRRTKAEDNV